MKEKELIIVLNFGRQSNQLAARRVRDMSVYCRVLPFDTPLAEIKEQSPAGVILTGGGAELQAGLPPNFDAQILGAGLPVLAVGNAAHIVAAVTGGALKSVDGGAYSRVGSTKDKLYGVAFKDAQSESAHLGDILKSFLFDVCGAKGSWTMASYAQQYILEAKQKYAGKKMLCALSGGVDSSVCAALLSKAVGKNLTCLFVDTGLMRKNEGDEVEAVFGKMFDCNFVRINAQERFLGRLKGVTDPERKRKIIGEEFIRVFEEEGRKIGEVDYLVQGTIYPDVIESDNVKSHHNVGGLPKDVKFKEIVEPLYWLFKDEVRRLGVELGLPSALAYRQPFPGPGLAVRVVGEVTRERLDILREADAIFREEIALAGLDREISQYFAVITDMRSVGVQDGRRTYDYTLALRAVKTTDFMTADCYELPVSMLTKISRRITDEVKGAGRIVYDITSKPPATIEWE